MGVVHKVKRAAAAAESQMNRSTASLPVSASSSPPISKYPRFGKRGAPQAFPSKLYEILEGENPDIVGWTPTGRGFEVRDHARLSSEVLGRFFKQDKFSSFQRQLNLYGFRKITKGSEAGSYQHPHFRRGERTTLLTIRRSTKASPARVVPNSPAFQPTAPAAPLSSSTDGSSSSSSLPPSSSAVTINSNGGSNKPRPATPSPPPAPVRGILPWSRLRGDAGSPVIPEAVRRVSMSAGNGENGDTLAAPPRCQAESAPRSADGHATENQRQPSDNRGANAGSWGVAQGRVGSYVDCMGAAPAPSSFQGEWKGGVRAPGTHVDSTATAINPVSGGMQHSVQSQSWREGAKSEHERTQVLDHRDVEVVGLLQRMAKEAQDSPSRQRSAAPTTGSATAPASTSTSRSMPTSRLEGEGSHGQASAPPVEAPHSNAHPHAQFRMSRSPQESGGAQHGKQASTERLHDILNHERVDNAPRGAFPYAFGTDGRVLGVSHQSRPRLPAPFPPAATLESYHEPLLRGSGDMSASDRSGSTGHGHREQDRGPSFEASPHTTVSRGGIVEGGGRPSFRYYDGVVEMDGFRRGGSGHWHGREGPYAVPPVSLPYNKYRGEENGKFGGAVGASVGPVQSEHSWAQHRQYQGGR